jgi:hypothetical protein
MDVYLGSHAAYNEAGIVRTELWLKMTFLVFYVLLNVKLDICL